MGVLGDSWCFCNGRGKSERTKAAIFSGKGPSMARVSTGTGFLIHRNLLLTTHAVLPSMAAAEAADIRLQNGAGASLFPHRFFVTSSVLDLTIVGLDAMDGDSNLPIYLPSYLKTHSKPSLELGSIVYLLGHSEKKELTVSEGKVVIATDNLIKVCPDGVTCSPGSAGFDAHGNLSFMVCDPMKLATSPTTKSSSTSSSSSSSDLPMQFGIPIPIIYDWLNQHWEGSLDDLVNKPKLPIIRLMSAGPKSEHSCASFTMRQVFKTTETDNEAANVVNDLAGPSSSPKANSFQDETPAQRIQTPEIYESRKLTSVPLRKKETTQFQLLDINFPPRITKPSVPPMPVKKKLPEELVLNPIAQTEIVSTGSTNGGQSEVRSCSSPIQVLEGQNRYTQVSEGQNGYNSDGETTMYSAETAESHNYPSPKDGKCPQQVGRSQSCVNHNRWGPNPVSPRGMLEQQRRFVHGRKVYSQGVNSQRGNDYYSPTVSSIMKKRNGLEPHPHPHPHRARPSVVHGSQKWMR